MNLVICGDSFTETGIDWNKQQDNWVWYHALADDLDCSAVHNFSIRGASNFNIWHQLQYAIETVPDIDYLLISLTRPNRVEKVLADVYDTPERKSHYKDFVNKDVLSWAVHEFVQDGDIPMSVLEQFFSYPLAESKDRIIVNDIVTHAKKYKSCIINNLFDTYTHNVQDISVRQYSDVITGELNEPMESHLYRSKHLEFYQDYSAQILNQLKN